jgi:uncharacterized membrane protein YkvA (DUF1232 family)
LLPALPHAQSLRTDLPPPATRAPAPPAGGLRLITPAVIRSLRDSLPELARKIRHIRDSDRLRARLELLGGYVAAVPDATGPADDTLREAAFALCYFLTGSDAIPDSLPEIGLVDDALLVEAVLRRHETELYRVLPKLAPAGKRRARRS